ncbi:MAG: pectate lyase [Pseudomonadota bacterium]
MIRITLIAALLPLTCLAADPTRQNAPDDGWGAGTMGGSAATEQHIYRAATRSALLAALAHGANDSKIILVSGTIDMSEGRPYASHADQGARGAIRLRNNTTLIGEGRDAGIVNGHLLVNRVSQVIIRNLSIVNPCDVGPVWDPADGPTGNWNSLFDGIGIFASDHVWIDHNSFTDAPLTDDLLPFENGTIKQCHDGALDITAGSDLITVSYNTFSQHDKNTLIGASDDAVGDAGKLRVTFKGNLYRGVASRAPRVRYGQVHLFNNYHAGTKAPASYRTSHSVGVGTAARIISSNNVFEVGGASACNAIIKEMAHGAPGAFSDQGSLLNGAPLGGCGFGGAPTWVPPYAFEPLPAAQVKAHVLANAGAGRMASD